MATTKKQLAILILFFPRYVMIHDKKGSEVFTRSQPKIDSNKLGNIGSPMKGEIIEVKVAVGDVVKKGQVVAIISAMKMEMAVQVNLQLIFAICSVLSIDLFCSQIVHFHTMEYIGSI